jgi:hypothetical protein
MRALLGTIVVLAVLLVGADIGGRLLAEHQAEKNLAAAYPNAADPQVTIHGFSFLLQAVQGHYSDITVSSSNLTLGALTGVNAQLDMRDVTLPLSDAISGNVSHLVARRADFAATIPAQALGDALSQPNLTIAPGADGSVQFGTTVSVAGRTIPVTVAGTASIDKGTLVLSAKVVGAGGIQLPKEISDKLTAYFSTTLPMQALPYPIDQASVSAQDGALIVTASGANVSAEQLGLVAARQTAKTTR